MRQVTAASSTSSLARLTRDPRTRTGSDKSVNVGALATGWLLLTGQFTGVACRRLSDNKLLSGLKSPTSDLALVGTASLNETSPGWPQPPLLGKGVGTLAEPQGANGKNIYAGDPTHEELFGPSGWPEVEDAQQGDLADCWLIASIIAVTHRNKRFMKRAIQGAGNTDDGHPAYRFRLHDISQESAPAAWVYVDNRVPTDGNGNQLGAAEPLDPNGNKRVLWVKLTEKATAVFNDAHHFVGNPGDQGYQAINDGGWDQGLTILTGNAAIHVPINPPNMRGDVQHALDDIRRHHLPAVMAFMPFDEVRGTPGYNADKQTLTFSDGSSIDYLGPYQTGNLLNYRSGNDQFTYVDNHAYALMDIDKHGNVRLRNPWGLNFDGATSKTTGAEFTVHSRHFGNAAASLYYSHIPPRLNRASVISIAVFSTLGGLGVIGGVIYGIARCRRRPF